MKKIFKLEKEQKLNTYILKDVEFNEQSKPRIVAWIKDTTKWNIQDIPFKQESCNGYTVTNNDDNIVITENCSTYSIINMYDKLMSLFPTFSQLKKNDIITVDDVEYYNVLSNDNTIHMLTVVNEGNILQIFYKDHEKENKFNDGIHTYYSYKK